jgi:Tol biopolymer transport system component
MTMAGPRRAEVIALVLVSALVWFGGCSDSPSGPCSDCPPAGQLVVSDPVSTLTLGAAAGTAPMRTSGAADEVAYVSLPPGTVPAGHTAIIRRLGDAGSTFATVRDGGFDPVPVSAGAGDSIDVIVRNTAGATIQQTQLVVAARRPPIVVRTDPPRKKTDVPLNAAIIVVFSEPVSESTLTSSSIRLFRGTRPVAGTVRLLDGSGTIAAFVPSTPLDRNTAYQITVAGAVRDLEGDALAAGVTVPFTTGQSSVGPAASITVSPDTVPMIGATYQMTATVRDAADNELIDQPVRWSTDDPNAVTVSASGLVTAVATGIYKVTAAVNGLTAEAQIIVVGGPAAAVVVSPTPATVAASGDTIVLHATVRDAAGRVLDHPSVMWTSSDEVIATVVADSTGSAGLAFATVTGVTPGSVMIIATSGTGSDTASVTVVPPPPIASLRVTPASATLLVETTNRLSATVQDANGKVLAGRPITWTTGDTAVATVDAAGFVRGVGVGSAAVIATSEGVSDTAAIAVELTVFAFTSDRSGNYEVYVMNADASVVANLTNNPASDYLGAWSPDGRKIAFWSLRDGNSEIYVMNADGSNQTRLTDNPSWDYAPAWSPDVQRIAFSRGGEIVVMNADGSGQTSLTNLGSVALPTWSPDGSKIAFSSNRDGTLEIYVMNADGSAQTRLTNDSLSHWDPEWSPDGRKIAFCDDAGADAGIYVMNADGSAQTRLTNKGCQPAWSPDGQKIAFSSTQDGNWQIYVMNADGSNPTRITNKPAEDILPRWRP